MKTFRLFLITAVAITLTACNNTTNNNIIERSSNEKNDVTITATEVLSSETVINAEQSLTEQEVYTEVTEQIIIDNCQVDVEGELTDIWTDELVNLINQEREVNSLHHLEYDVTLSECAAIRAQEASQIWSHTRPSGDSWNTVAQGFYRGENLARGYFSAQEVFDAWMASESHRNNILYKDYTTIGIAIFKTERGYVVATGFGL